MTTLDSLRIVLDPLGQAGVVLALMMVMFGVALGLRVGDFRILGDKPRVFIGGAAAIPAVWGVWHIVAGGALALAYKLVDAKRDERKEAVEV